MAEQMTGAAPGGAGSARHGAYDKRTVPTEIGEVELRVPRYRRGIFELGPGVAQAA